MRSKQLNFFVKPQDIIVINEFLREKQCIIFVEHDIGSAKNPHQDLSSIDKSIFQVYLTTGDQDRNIMELKTKKGKEYFDIYSSPLIQFTLPRYDSERETLHRSRFYFISAYYDEKGYLVEKDKHFANWASSVMKEFKKRFLINSGSDKEILFEPKVLEWMRETGAVLNVPGTLIEGIPPSEESE